MLSVIILTKNEEETIEACIKSIKDIADEILVIDSYSSDKTVDIAKKYKAKIFENKLIGFSTQRNFAMEKAKGDWVLYIDADEQATYEFTTEIKNLIRNFDKNSQVAGFWINRKTFFFDRDWNYTDKVQRLFYKKFFEEWTGELHETPLAKGKFSNMNSYVLHFTHRDLSRMLEKTNEWSEYEADLRFKSHHPKMSWWRFLRVMLTGFLKSYIKEKGYKNGTEGLIESIYQGFSMFVTYSKLWERQIAIKKDTK